MNLFDTVKAAVTPRMAAERYGLPIKQGNMSAAHFTMTGHPAMKLNEDYFYCFGCGASGDVIDLAARLFGLSGYEAAKKLAADFGIAGQKRPFSQSYSAANRRQKPNGAASACWGTTCKSCGTGRSTVSRNRRRTPSTTLCGGLPHAGTNRKYAGHSACGTPQERAEVVADLQKDERLMRMEARNRQIKEEAHGTK